MKKIFLIAICALGTFVSKAQNTTDDVAVLQSAYGLDKKQIIVEHMKFTEAESAKFWPAYDKYEAERKELGRARVNNILEYSKNYDSLSNEKASELINAALNNQMAFTKLQQKAYKDMSSALSPLRAAQWIQLEVFLETVIRAEIAEQIPLVKQVDAHKKN